MENNEKKVKLERTYTIKVIEYEDGTRMLQRENTGFNILELLGIGNLLSVEFTDMALDRKRYDIIERTYINNEDGK